MVRRRTQRRLKPNNIAGAKLGGKITRVEIDRQTMVSTTTVPTIEHARRQRTRVTTSKRLNRTSVHRTTSQYSMQSQNNDRTIQHNRGTATRVRLTRQRSAYTWTSES